MLSGLPPVARADARLLVLGSFPGSASLRAAQYYAHPRNAFWPLMAELLGIPALTFMDYETRLVQLTARGVALWDVLIGCERRGSLDTAIRSAQVSPLEDWVAQLPALRGIACNGALAARTTRRLLPQARVPIWALPSTSPAHAALPWAAKRAAWAAAVDAALGAPESSG